MTPQKPHLLFRVAHNLRQQMQRAVDKVDVQLDHSEFDLPRAEVWVRRSQLVILGLGVGVLGWSIFARIDVVVTARGKLEPLSSSQSVQSRAGGVVTAVLVQDGQTVKQGQILMQLDKAELLNRLEALLRQREPIAKQVTLLRLARQGRTINAAAPDLKIPQELLSQVQRRNLLLAKLTGNSQNLTAEQLQQYNLFVQGLNDIRSLSQLQASALETQATGADAQLVENQARLRSEQQQLAELTALRQSGGISRTDYLRRVTELNTLQNQFNQNQVQRRLLDVNRVQTQIDGQKTIADQLRTVQAELSQLDAQIDNTLQTNQSQLTQFDAQLKQLKLDLQAQEVKAPTNGVVFDLATRIPGLFAQPGQVLVKVSPNEALIARVQVANADAASLSVGIPVEVRLDAYPFTENGSISGVVTKISSEAVPADPNQRNGQTVFPVEIRLDQPFLERQGKRLTISPGMTLSVNMKTQSRAPISYVAEPIIKAFDAMRSVR
ncbi:HlyD family type I secretion periplasmic adaptor subunit [Leptolyngbya sp. NIES-2104]|uniref:HlyD family type I secretion periplasmic adaptor subunit n=1 Tax=Leptolyngbya sp. NIES-2104 TaxID=1552121 RepID=UPI0006ECA385|nr:HlyD family type I secretion periplasmic adaptor subunit [Leptolyngbya sp. NIES-2104]GAP99595.1 HlyD family secretion protein [Leptolyngbya sp. NIES-2104]